MALPNATKINYGNVDDITPTEMNNVGSNLISLGQKVQQVVDDTWITTNADWNGTAWDRIDIAKAASALQIGINGSKTFWNAGAGANPIVWVKDRQLIQKVGDDTWVLVNAYWTGTVWDRIDIAKEASALQIGIDGSKTGWNAAAGANPIVWVQGEKWDASGKLVAGVVPFGVMAEHFFNSSSVVNVDLNVGPVSVGDIILISTQMLGSVTPDSDARHSSLILPATGNTASWIGEPPGHSGRNQKAGFAESFTGSGFLRITVAGTAIIRNQYTASPGTVNIPLNQNKLGAMLFRK